MQNVSTSNLISGGASADYDTLKEIEDKMKQLEAGEVATESKCNNYDAALEDVSQLKEDTNNLTLSIGKYGYAEPYVVQEFEIGAITEEA